PERVRGSLLAPVVALPDRHQRLPRHAERTPAPGSPDGPSAGPPRLHPTARAAAGGDLALADPGRADRGTGRRPRRARRVKGVRPPRVRRGAPAPPAAAARGADPS